MNKSRILIIDDDQDFTSIICNFLNFEGFNCSYLHETENLSEQLDQENYDCILLDIFLQSVNGLELLPMLREKQPFAKIVVVTSKSSVPLAVSSMEAGAIRF